MKVMLSDDFTGPNQRQVETFDELLDLVESLEEQLGYYDVLRVEVEQAAPPMLGRYLSFWASSHEPTNGDA